MDELFAHFVFESPWPLAVVLAVAAAAVQVTAMRRGSKRMMFVAPALLLLAAGTVAAGYAVETANEAVDRHTRELIAATAPLDAVVIRTMLADDVRLLDPAGAVWMSGNALRDRLVSIAGSRKLDQRVASLGVEASVDDSGARVAVLELRTRDASGVPILSSWALHWRPRAGSDGSAWELFDVRWLTLAGQSPDRSLIP